MFPLFQYQAFFSTTLVRRQIAGGMYSAFAYVSSVLISNMPLQVRYVVESDLRWGEEVVALSGFIMFI